MSHAPPVIWSIAGLDSAGGAGLSADQRAADALGVHLCPITAALTAQHSQGVEAVFPVATSALQAQIAALADDLPPRVIKTGLLGSVEAIELVAKWVDHVRGTAPANRDPHETLALVVDPVLGASAGGASFASDAVVDAYRRWLLPKATVITPNRAEARRLLGLSSRHEGPHEDIPVLAQKLLQHGAQSVIITGGDAPDHRAYCLDWLQTPYANGWLCSPRIDTRHTHGTGCTFASSIAAAMALGHVSADAAVIAKMVTHHAIQRARQAGEGAGPVLASREFSTHVSEGGAPLPWLGLGDALPWVLTEGSPAPSGPIFQRFHPPANGLYGILPTADLALCALRSGLRCVQLRHKAKLGAQDQIRLLDQWAAAPASSELDITQVFINDHWEEALNGLSDHTSVRWGIHLGQEDLLALTSEQKHLLLSTRDRWMLGLSTHSLWELARAAGCGASLIACGPVQTTTTKDMPWLPQGLSNLAWWVRHSPAPVVAIGGLLSESDLARFAGCRPAALCVVRGLGQDASHMPSRIEGFASAVAAGMRAPPVRTPRRPRPVLPR